MKLYSIIISDSYFLGVTHDNRTCFFIYDLLRSLTRFKSVTNHPISTCWDYSEKTDTIVESNADTIFMYDAQTGLESRRFKIPTTDVESILIFNDLLRLTSDNTIYTYNIYGESINTIRLKDDVVFFSDHGHQIVTEGKFSHSFQILDSAGNNLSEHELTGLALNSVSSMHERLLITETRGLTTVLDKFGQLVDKILSPNGYHPVKAGADANGRIFVVHGELPMLKKSIFTIHSMEGGLIHEQTDIQLPLDLSFAPELTAWICGDCCMYGFNGNKFEKHTLNITK